MKLCFIGLGVMGAPMAGHLARAGHDIHVFNRSPGKAEALAVHAPVTIATSLLAASQGADLVFLCLGRDDDVREIVHAILPSLAPGGVIVDHTTTSATLARDMALLLHATGRGFVDAPVSGGQKGAEDGILSVMAGGTSADLAKAKPYLQCYAKAITHMGPSGAGQLAKMCNQICIAGVVQGLAEAMQFAERSGLDQTLVFQAISKGAAQSWQMDNRWPTMAQRAFNFGFAVDWMRKDLNLTLDEAARLGADLPVTALVDRFYAEVQAKGGGRWDTSSLVTRFDDLRETQQ